MITRTIYHPTTARYEVFCRDCGARMQMTDSWYHQPFGEKSLIGADYLCGTCADKYKEENHVE